jgi:hypothetical protein
VKNVKRAAAVILVGGLLSVGGASAAQAAPTVSLPGGPCLIVGGCPVSGFPTFPTLPTLPGVPELPELPGLPTLPGLPFLPSGS